MATLTTDFIKIAQAGPALDGRTIKEDWIRDMGKTYDPATYTALIWPEHIRWNGNYGEVVEAKAQADEEGRLSLYVRLRPSAMHIWDNSAGQGLFYSIEVTEDFADTGKAYLTGLGVTDSPASLGLTSTRFFAENGGKISCYSTTRVGALTQPEKKPLLTAEEKSFFKRIFSHFTQENNESTDTAEQKKDTKMEDMEARLEALEGLVATMQEAVADHSARLSELEIDVAAGGATPAAEEGFNSRAIGKHFARLNKEIAGVKSLLHSAQTGTKAPAGTGAVSSRTKPVY